MDLPPALARRSADSLDFQIGSPTSPSLEPWLEHSNCLSHVGADLYQGQFYLETAQTLIFIYDAGTQCPQVCLFRGESLPEAGSMLQRVLWKKRFES